MNFDLSLLTGRAWPWIAQNWEILLAAAIILALAVAARRWLRPAAPKPRPALVQTVDDRPNMQALDIATAAAAEIVADIEAYARALFSEDFGALAGRAAAGAPQPLRLATIAEAPFIYDGVIMRDVALMPNALIAPVGNHFRHAQTILDALRRLSQLAPPDAAVEDRVAALRAVAASLAAGLEKATFAAEKLDQWLVKNGGTSEPPSFRDLPVPALRNASVERLGQRAKTYRLLREQAQARLADIDSAIEDARRASLSVSPTLIAPKPSAASATAFDPAAIIVKPGDKTAAE